MKIASLLLLSLVASGVNAADIIPGMMPNPICKQAADKIVASLPPQAQANMSSDILARRLEQVIPQRVENQRLVEQVIFQEAPLQSEGTMLLLLQVNNEAEAALQNKRSHDMLLTDCSIFAVLISVLTVMLTSS